MVVHWYVASPRSLMDMSWAAVDLLSEDLRRKFKTTPPTNDPAQISLHARIRWHGKSNFHLNFSLVFFLYFSSSSRHNNFPQFSVPFCISLHPTWVDDSFSCHCLPTDPASIMAAQLDIMKSFILYFLFPFILVTIIIMALPGNKIKVPSPSPRIMSPMGFAVHRQARHTASMMDENSLYDDFDGDGDQSYIRPVPIWLCVFLVIGYIIGGAFMFQAWEEWEFLDAAYFCFITLTTIGKLSRRWKGELSVLAFSCALSW